MGLCSNKPTPNVGVSQLALPRNGADGYIDQALAFLDANHNSVRDFLDLNGNGLQELDEPDEPWTITSANGGFVLVVRLP